jgi:predicted MFS family arabinose efflux permease
VDEHTAAVEAKGSWAPLTAVVTLAMTSGTLLPVALGALGPFIVQELAISRSNLGALVTVTFVTASATSMVIGKVADSIHERRFLLLLFLYTSAVLAGASAAPTYTWLFLPFALAGLPLAASNPITNKLVAAHIPVEARGMAMGIKQSGVPVGILLAGLILPSAALSLGWQGTLLAAAIVPLAVAVLGLATLPRSDGVERPRASLRPTVPQGLIRRLMVFAFFIGGGVAATHTFLPLFAHEELRYAENVAGITLSTIGLTGIIARILWTHLSSRARSVQLALVAVGCASVVSSLIFLFAPSIGRGAVWVGAAIQGGSAVAWAPIAMLAVLQSVDYHETGHASAMVNLGFFAGFILSPPAFGYLVEAAGYAAGWIMVAAQFAVAVLVLTLSGRKRERAAPHL